MRTLLAILMLLSPTASLASDISSLGLGEIRAQVARGANLYVAPASGGVVVVDLSDPAAPKLVSRFAPGRPVSRLLVAGDSLVVLESHEEATTWSLVDPRAPALAVGTPVPAATPVPVATVATAAAPPPAVPAPARAKVVEVRGGRVIF